jgi:hypothetical protein
MITAKHLAFHGLKLAEYQAKYPEAKLKTDQVQATWSEKSRAHVQKQHQDPQFKASLRRGALKVVHLAHAQTRKLNEDLEFRRAKQKRMKVWWDGLSPEDKETHIRKSVPRSFHYVTRNGKAVVFRSKLELTIAYCLDLLEIPWESESVALPFQENGEQRFYVPDFVLRTCYVEAKSAFTIAKNPERWTRKQACVDRPLVVVTPNTLRTLGLLSIYQWMGRNSPRDTALSFTQIHAKWGTLDASRLKSFLPNL